MTDKTKRTLILRRKRRISTNQQRKVIMIYQIS